MPTPRHIQMRGEFQGVESDSVNDDGQNVQDHIQSVAEDQKNDGKYHKHEIAEQGTDQLIDGSGDCRACNADRIRISLSSPLTSINIEPADDDTVDEDLYMLLPVRMKE